MPQLDALLALLGGARDNALLRFAIASAYHKNSQLVEAEMHLHQALTWQADYTAAWKLLGKVLVAANKPEDAIRAYQQGITVASAHGDVQAKKEMMVFLRRLQVVT